jgi:putative heme-binding domain-containing protein
MLWFRKTRWLALLIGLSSWGSGAALWAQQGATAPSAFKVPEGFEVELLHEVPLAEQGSWVSMCVDLEGRLIVSDQYGKLYRVALPKKEGEKVTVESLDVSVGMAQGLLHTRDGLYVNINGEGPSGAGLYRLQDLDKDGKFEKQDHLIPLNAGGEHGPHALIEGPDGRIYLCAGNATDLPAKIDRYRVPKHWSEDHLLGRMPDARGFMADRLAPGGFVLSFRPDGSDVELVATGFRNEYDIAFNPLGDLFTYDADMEWDVGTPWYRPTRVNHVIGGAEFGWRNGTGKWPEYFADSMGAVANIGPGSPTGICFGTGAKFPAKYQRALLIGDWSYGVIYAVHLTPEGSSYQSTFEPFVSASPMPITDMVVHPSDGNLYFMIGGRKVQSGLYRLKYKGTESTAPAAPIDSANAAQARSLRRNLEQLQAPGKPGAVSTSLAMLGHPDRAVRFAARIALEHQPVTQWRGRVMESTNPQSLITGSIALARCGEPSDQTAIHQRLASIDWGQLDRTQKLELLRAYQLSFTRLGEGSPETRQAIVAQLDRHFPVPDEDSPLNRELATVLVYLAAPGITDRCIARMSNAQSADEQIHYAMALRDVKEWTDEQRQKYFQWFIDVSTARGGASFGGFLANIRKVAISHLNDEQKQKLGELVGDLPEPRDPLADLAPRPLVQEWKVEDLAEEASQKNSGYDFSKGKQLFAIAQCYKCHRFQGQGGIQGPDLTAVSGRFSPREMLTAIIEPNKEISDQYQATQFITEDDQIVVGRVANLNGSTLMITTNMLDPQNFTNLDRKSITEMKPSPNSMMPSGLLNTLSKEEVFELLAYMKSGGNPAHPLYQQATATAP